MPVEWRLQVLEDRLNGGSDEWCEIEAVDLLTVTTEERDAALDALLESGSDFPVVLVDGRVACVGDIDVEAVVTAVASAGGEGRG